MIVKQGGMKCSMVKVIERMAKISLVPSGLIWKAVPPHPLSVATLTCLEGTKKHNGQSLIANSLNFNKACYILSVQFNLLHSLLNWGDYLLLGVLSPISFQ